MISQQKGTGAEWSLGIAKSLGPSWLVMLLAACPSCTPMTGDKEESTLIDGGSALDAESGRDAPDASDDAMADPAPIFTAEDKAALALLAPTTLPAPPPDPTNAYADNAQAASFGQRLFFDPGFSGPLTDHDNDGSPDSLGTPPETGKVACASCHNPSHGFADWRSFQRSISLGSGWGRRRAPSLLDVGQAKLLAWDGRRDAAWNQIFGPLETFVEMNSSRLFFAEQIYARYKTDYEAVFGPLPDLSNTSRFPSIPASQTGCYPSKDTSSLTCDQHTYGVPGDSDLYEQMSAADQDATTRIVVNAGKAIEAYERKLSCGPGAFDAWEHGDASALSRSQQRGAILFVGKAKCVSCHSGPFMSDQKFHNVGLIPQQVQGLFIDSNDRGAGTGLAAALTDPLNTLGMYSDLPGGDGRLPTSVPTAAEGAFRTPTLRCLSERPTYMHTGQILTGLADVVTFFNTGGDASSHPLGVIGTTEIAPLGLSAMDQSDLVAFLKSLEGAGPDPSLTTPPLP